MRHQSPFHNAALAVALILSAGHLLMAEIKTSEVSYKAGTVTAKGYLAVPADGKPGAHPGVLVVHEWWGHNAYARKRAEMLAEMGYTALAVDMYGGGKNAGHPKDAGAFAAAVRNNMGEARARFVAAMKLLNEQSATDREHTAAIGYCFGGSIVLQMALDGVEGLDGVASFHGALGGLSFPKGKSVPAKFLVCHGAADPFISDDHVKGFKSSIDKAKASMKFVAYEGASHSFTNPDADALAKKFGMPIGYDEKADKASWAELDRFLKETLK